MAAVAGSMLALTGPVEAEQCVGRGTTFMHHDVQQTWVGEPATSTVGSSARSIDEHARSSHRDEKGRKVRKRIKNRRLAGHARREIVDTRCHGPRIFLEQTQRSTGRM